MTPFAMFLFFLAVVLQIVMIFMLPQTRGYTVPLPTIACLASINAAIFFMARLVHGGMNLSLLIPLSAAVVPLGAIAIGVFAYGESAPILKIVLLCGACGLIGVASAIR